MYPARRFCTTESWAPLSAVDEELTRGPTRGGDRCCPLSGQRRGPGSLRRQVDGARARHESQAWGAGTVTTPTFEACLNCALKLRCPLDGFHRRVARFTRSPIQNSKSTKRNMVQVCYHKDVKYATLRLMEHSLPYNVPHGDHLECYSHDQEPLVELLAPITSDSIKSRTWVI